MVTSAADSCRDIPRNEYKYKEGNMRKIITVVLVLGLVAVVAPQALATNGDNLIGIGPISRSMGGVGIAFPQDAISATFANPAGMCFGPYCPGSEVNFAGTLFMPEVDTKVQALGQTFTADSDDKVYAIPAIGLSWPITTKLRAGISAFGVSGLGVDYRGTAIDDPTAFQPPPGPLPQFPLVAGEYTQLQIMKFAPTVAYQVTDALSVGAAVQITYANLDLRNGSSFDYGFGIQPGILYKPTDWLYLGATYVMAQSIDYENVVKVLDPFTGFQASSADLELEQPQEVGVGVALEPILGKLLFEVNYKWIDWASAEGYEQFDWDSQNVVSVGAQFKPTEQLALRVGYNYGENPVNEHNGWDGTINPGTGLPNDVVNVQGTPFPRYYYETFRIVGFPAFVEHHITAGIGYEVSEKFALNVGYMHAFEETLSETGTDFFGNPAVLESTLSEDSVEFGMTLRF
jgi:long-chain fatty acid transport protein